MKFKSLLLMTFIALPCLCASLCANLFAQALVLKPGETQTVNFDQLRYLEKGVVPLALPKVIARATITLQADGATLVVKLQHVIAARGLEPQHPGHHIPRHAQRICRRRQKGLDAVGCAHLVIQQDRGRNTADHSLR